MNPLLEAAKVMRETAEHVESLANEPAPPEALGDLGAALRLLRALKLETCCLELKIWVRSDGRKDRVEWSVWDGNEHHKGQTVDSAVSQAIAAAAVVEDPVADAAKALMPTEAEFAAGQLSPKEQIAHDR